MSDKPEKYKPTLIWIDGPDKYDWIADVMHAIPILAMVWLIGAMIWKVLSQ